MKTMKYFWMLALALVAFNFTSCKDDDDEGSQTAPMTISKVYLENINDEENKDREVDFARLGQLIRIEGSGFKGLKKILINGYETYFNNALMTDNNVWVTLNSETPVDKADDDVRNTIQLVKDGTKLVYPFTIRAAAPSITSVDNTLPMPGETVTVYGTNLQETTKLTLPGGIEITSGIISDEEGKFYSFTMPSGVSESGSSPARGPTARPSHRPSSTSSAPTSPTSTTRADWALGAPPMAPRTWWTTRWAPDAARWPCSCPT
jgi:hypothetical protein